MNTLQSCAFVLAPVALTACLGTQGPDNGHMDQESQQHAATSTARLRVFQAAGGRGLFVDHNLRPFVPRGVNHARQHALDGGES